MPTRFEPDRWLALRRSPPFYPDAVSLTERPRDILAGIDLSPGCSVKDSFATLDLAPAGFEVLFDAEWIYREPVESPGPSRYPRTDRPVVEVEGAIGNLSDGCVGISNVRGDDVWEDAVAAISAHWPGLPLVGYETADTLPAAHAAGFRSIGPLRIWMIPESADPAEG